MSKDQNGNPLQIIFKASEKCAQYIHKHLSHFIQNVQIPSPIQQPLRPSPNNQLTLVQPKEAFATKVMQSLPKLKTCLTKFPSGSRYYKPYISAGVPITKIGSSSRFTSIYTSTPVIIVEQSARPLTKEELGRSTWTLLHTIAAQFPDHPTRQQKRDVKELMTILSRIYPCKECADHFKEVLSANPVQAESQAEFAQWLCHAHNVVNRSLGKPIFPCQRVDARWGKLECKDRACDLQGITLDFDKWTDA